MQPTKYHLSVRILHWFMASVIFFLIGLGIYMAEFLSKEATNRQEIYNLHKSFGVMILILIFVRIINRLCHRTPHLPQTIPTYEKILAYLVHIGLYALMLAVPISGYLMSNYYGYPVNLFEFKMMFLVSRNVEMGQFFGEIHELTAYSLLALVTLHILGALKHRFFDRPENDVIKRIF